MEKAPGKVSISSKIVHHWATRHRAGSSCDNQYSAGLQTTIVKGLKNFEMEVIDIFLVGYYDMNDAEKVPIIKNWLGRKGV